MLAARRLLPRFARWPAARALSSEEPEDEIDSYWTDMERRVARRKPRPRGPGAPVGRGRVPKTEADYWLAAGLYDPRGSASARVAARLSSVRVKRGELDAARATYEGSVLPALRSSAALVAVSVFVDEEASVLSALSSWSEEGAFAEVAKTPVYEAAVAELAAHFEDAAAVPTSVDVGHYRYGPEEAS